MQQRQRTLLLCMLIHFLLSTSISASAFGRFRVKSPSGRSHYEEENDNDEGGHDNDDVSRGNNNNDNDLDKRIRGRQRQQQQQQHQRSQQESSSWLDGMEMEDDYHVPPSSDHDDHDDHHHALLDSQQTHPLLQIPCAIHLPDASQVRSQPVRTFCDTGAQRTVMSWDCAQRTGLLQHLDRRYAGQAMGVGSCRVLGRIPAGIGRLTLNGLVSIPSPAITVLESTTGGSSNSESSDSHDATAGVELLLGLDFLRDYQAILNLRTEELELIVDDDEGDNGNREVRIPFIRPRGGRSPRGGARAEASSPTARRHSSSESSSSRSSSSSSRHNSRARVHPLDEWESEEEDDDDESDESGDIDMSGV